MEGSSEMHLSITGEFPEPTALHIPLKSGHVTASVSAKKNKNKLLPFFKKMVKGIIVDLSGVSFMDSSGIATLVEGLQWSKKEKRQFILTGLGTN
ncbi:MAG: STAS domain-containing protein, partial [Methanoregula sp.]|nr:STAS domain-containing protein [Methanoregula sp.]